MNENGTYAKRILFHYIGMVMRDVDRHVDSDTRAELDGAVDDIIDPLVRRLDEQDKRIKMLERHVKALLATAAADEEFEDWKTGRDGDGA